MDTKILEKIVVDSEVILVVGKRGGGKSALGYLLLEKSSNPYVFGLSPSAWQYLPEYITPLEDLENIPQDATVFVDEAGLYFYSRDSLKKQNKFINYLIAMSRHLGQRFIFAVHALRRLDVGLVLDCNAILFKQPSLLHSKLERGETRELTALAERHFNSLKEEDPRKYVFVLSHDFEEFIEVPLPSFWCEELSKAKIQIEEIGKGNLQCRSPDLAYSQKNLYKPLRVYKEHGKRFIIFEDIKGEIWIEEAPAEKQSEKLNEIKAI